MKSMTGFGAAVIKSELGQIAFEIKTWNNRFLEIYFRTPQTLSSFENILREKIKSKIFRGKIEVYLRWEQSVETLPKFEINRPALEKLVSDLKEIQSKFNLKSTIHFDSLLLLPGMTSSIVPEMNEKRIEELLISGIESAVEQVLISKKEEGKKLEDDITKHLNIVEEHLITINNIKDSVIDQYRKKLAEKINQFLGANEYNLSDGRLEAEVLFFAERSDITEEIVRLQTHIKAFREYLKRGDEESIGKPLEFICQEMLREVNTIGSKSRDTKIAINVLKMKNDIEKIREQIQNIE